MPIYHDGDIFQNGSTNFHSNQVVDFVVDQNKDWKTGNGKAIRKASTSQKLYNDVFLARQQNKRKEYHIEKYWPDVYYARIVSSAHVYRK